jgi:hypothetical protein
MTFADGGSLRIRDQRRLGSIELDPILAKKHFADLVDEVVQQFTMRTGVKVNRGPSAVVSKRSSSGTVMDWLKVMPLVAVWNQPI